MNAKKRRVYVAGPLFSDQDRNMLELLERSLKKQGLQTYLPHKHGGDLGSIRTSYGKGKIRNALFRRDMIELEKATVLVALLDGSDVDSGTAVEMGIAYRLGIPIFGLKTDMFRRGRVLNNMVWGVCSGGRTLAFSLPRLLSMVRTYLRGKRRA